MSLFVDIEKKIGDFLLCSRFEAENETLAILGASGSGKSMTLKCIAGVETPDRGRIVLDNRVLFDSTQKINVPARLRKAGYLFQNYALFPNMTVAQNIACGIPKAQKEQKAPHRRKNRGVLSDRA
jgi:molybdate transport system ATP-binding protein